MIYVIRCTATGLRKIGSASDWLTEGRLEKRLSDLQTGSAAPHILEAFADGEADQERVLHTELRDHRVRRRSEWFDVGFEEIERATTAANLHFNELGRITWRKVARAWWTRVSALGFEPRITVDDGLLRLLDDDDPDSGAAEPFPAAVDTCRAWIRENCRRVHSWGMHSSTLARRIGCRKQPGAVIAAALAEHYPVKRSDTHQAVFCMAMRVPA